MTVHQCPKCELRFDLRTVLDDHCRSEHPQFHHDYPIGRAAHPTPDHATEEVSVPQPQQPPAMAAHDGDGTAPTRHRHFALHMPHRHEANRS
jgi:hypothetical protein